jgi:hypothetical protein
MAGIAHAPANTVEALVPIQDRLVLCMVSLAAALVMILAGRVRARLPPMVRASIRPATGSQVWVIGGQDKYGVRI